MREPGSNIVSQRPTESVSLFAGAVAAFIIAVATEQDLTAAITAVLGAMPAFTTFLVEKFK